MHNQGTAVLDRPAEATSAQALSALVIGACARDQEPARSSHDPARELATRYDARNLTYVELAVALNASGARPKRLRSADPAQLMAWAAQGLALLGIDRVRCYARRTCDLNALHLQDCLSADTRAEYARMWPDSTAVQPCHDAAWRLTFGPRPACPPRCPGADCDPHPPGQPGPPLPASSTERAARMTAATVATAPGPDQGPGAPSRADFDRWEHQLAVPGTCSHPIRLTGRIDAIDLATGELARVFDIADEPGGVVQVNGIPATVSQLPFPEAL